MVTYDKDEVKELLTTEDVFEIVQEFGGEPEITSYGFLSATICHNIPGDGSKKLYYYANTKLFRCYTGCDETFDIFGLLTKIHSIQYNNEAYTLGHALKYIAYRFNLSGAEKTVDNELIKDWTFLDNYDRIKEIKNNQSQQEIILKEYDDSILSRLAYPKIIPWLKEGISQEVLTKAQIGYFAGGEQISIPHFDQNRRFIGLRGRALGDEEAIKFGKYRPILINNILYRHPLGLNLYNLNNSQKQIQTMEKAILFESEKSCLLYQSYFGIDNDIAVACCGSSVTNYHIQLLIKSGAKEIILAFDRQFQDIGDKEFKQLTKKLVTLFNKYKNYVRISMIFDKGMKTPYKASPIDSGKNMFLELFYERIDL